MNYFKLLYLIILLLLPSGVFSQNLPSDSLNYRIKNAKNNTERIEAYFDLGSYWYSGGEHEKAIAVYQKVADEYCASDKEKCLDAKNYQAFNLIVIEEYEKAKHLLGNILDDAEKLKYKHGLLNAYRNTGLLNTYQGYYEEAAGFYLKAIGFAQQNKNIMKEADLYADLGMNFYFQENYEKAAEYWEKAIEIKPDKNSSDYIGYCANLGQAYVELQKFDEAEKYFLKARDFYKKENSIAYANALNGLGVLESHRKNKMKALEYFIEELQVRQSNKSRNDALASVYLNISSIYTDLNMSPEALKFARDGLEKALLSDNKYELLHAYGNINTAYSKMKEYEKAYTYSLLYNDLRDSLSNIESKKNINELDTKYQTVQKEKKNQELKQQIEIKEIESQRQRLIISLIGIVLIALGIIAYVLVRQNKLKTAINAELALKNNIIQEKSKIVREQNKDITDSINYAKRIQEAILPPIKHWNEILPDSFVLYQPKDILSGDFYWLYKTADSILLRLIAPDMVYPEQW
jgi:tetratricopeptide (TPR) repeat protein